MTAKKSPRKKVAAKARPNVPPRLLPPDPLFSYAGVKDWAVETLKEITKGHLPQRRVVELFCGSLAISLGLRPERALINDFSPYLISFYREVKKGFYPQAPVPTTEDEWLVWREKLADLYEAGVRGGPEFAEAAYIVLAGMFRGMYRTNESGVINQSWQKRKAKLVTWSDYRDAFSGFQFQCGDWKDVVIRPDDLVIADPPYHGTWCGYNADGFPLLEQMELLRTLLRHPGPSVLHNDQRIANAYAFWGMTCLMVERTYGGNKRKKAKEVIALNNLPVPASMTPAVLPNLYREAADLYEKDLADKARLKAAKKARAAARKRTAKRRAKA